MTDKTDSMAAAAQARQEWLEALAVGDTVAVGTSRGGYHIDSIAEVAPKRFKTKRFRVGQTWFNVRGNSLAYHQIEPVTDKIREAINHQNALRCVQQSINVLSDNRNHLAKVSTSFLLAAETSLRSAIDLLKERL